MKKKLDVEKEKFLNSHTFESHFARDAKCKSNLWVFERRIN